MLSDSRTDYGERQGVEFQAQLVEEQIQTGTGMQNGEVSHSSF